MIVIKVEMWPGGDEATKYEHGQVRITNIGGTRERCDYKVELFKSPRLARTVGVWRRAVVKDFPRLRLGLYDLLLRGLLACIASRSQAAVSAAGDAPELGDEAPLAGYEAPP
jgi:hypothetical protein